MAFKGMDFYKGDTAQPPLGQPQVPPQAQQQPQQQQNRPLPKLEELDAAATILFKEIFAHKEGDEKHKTKVENALEGMHIKFGTPFVELDVTEGVEKLAKHVFDVEIDASWNPDAAAFTVGAVDQIGDPWRGIGQALQELGVSGLIDTEQQDANEDLLRELYDDDVYGTAGMAGAVTGAIAEPLGLLIPGLKFKKASSALLYGATVGGIYGSTLYVDKEESRLNNALLGVAVGGPAGVVAHGIVNKMLRHKFGSKVKDRIDEIDHKESLWRLEGDVEKIEGKPHYVSQKATTGKPHYTNPHVAREAANKIKKKAKKPHYKSPQAARKAMTPDQQTAETATDIEAKVSLEGSRHSTFQKFKNVVDQGLQPIRDNIAKYSPKIAAMLVKTDATQHRLSKIWTDRTKKFNDWFDNLPKETAMEVHKMLTGGITKGAINRVRQIGGEDAVDALKEVRLVLADIMKEYKAVGYKIDEMPAYFPRSIKDIDELRKAESGVVEDLLERARLKKAERTKNPKATLTTNEETHVLEHYFQFDARFSRTSPNLKKRKVREVKDEHLTHYNDPVTTLHYYVSTAAEDISKRQFFKSNGYRPKAGEGLDVTGGDIQDSIDTLVGALKGMSPDSQREVAKLLQSRFNADVHKTHKFVQAWKNISYATTLGNIWSAMTQVGDIVFAAHKYGIRPTIKSILGRNIYTKEDLGIDKAMLELNSARMPTAKMADWAFKWGGFDAVDRFGKNVNINASLRANKKLAMKNPEKFREKWGTMFGDETDTLMSRLKDHTLKKGEPLDDNMHLMLWNDLADTQPIGLSEMPKKYLDMPNGRLVYAYKTFTIKQLNYMRKMVRDKSVSPVKRGYNLAMFTFMFITMNSSVDKFKKFMAGEELDTEDAIVDNALGMFGTSKYAVDKSKGLGSIALETFIPPPVMQAARAFDTAVPAVSNLFTGSNKPAFDVETMGRAAVRNVPVFGKPIKEWDVVQK